MPKPLVTVITPTYNCGKFIEQTVKSVLIQGYPNMDYILIDDCSTDNTQAILNKYGNAIKLISHDQNKGEQATVNDGLKCVFGKYFMIVNADDPLLPGAISKLVDFMEAHPDVFCAYPDWQVIGEDGAIRRKVQVREYDFAYLVSHHTWMMSVGSIFRSDVIQKIGYRDESFRWLGDADYWLRIGLVGKMARVPETLACWRLREGQASRDKSDDRAQEHIRVMERFYNSLKPKLMPVMVNNVVRIMVVGGLINKTGILKHESEAMAWACLVAASVTDSKLKSLDYVLSSANIFPGLYFKPEFWDTLFKRAIYILRR